MIPPGFEYELPLEEKERLRGIAVNERHVDRMLPILREPTRLQGKISQAVRMERPCPMSKRRPGEDGKAYWGCALGEGMCEIEDGQTPADCRLLQSLELCTESMALLAGHDRPHVAPYHRRRLPPLRAYG